MLAPPAAPMQMRSAVNGGQVLLTWVPPDDLDLSAFELRWSSDPAAGWGSATVVQSSIPGQSMSIQVPARNGRYLLKSIDFSGSYSVGAASVVVESANSDTLNFVEAVEEGPTFTGDSDGLTLFGGALRLSSASPVSSWTPVASAQPIAGENVTSGVYAFSQSIDLGAPYACRVTPSATFTALAKRSTVASWRPIASARPISGASGDDVSVTFDVRVDGGAW